jgi:chromosome segregation and condensation protein ScpB
LRLPADLVGQLAHDATLVQTGVSAARPYGWSWLDADRAWRLEADVVAGLGELADQVGDSSGEDELEAVLLRVVDGPWPFPPTTIWRRSPLQHSICSNTRTRPRNLGREVLRWVKEIAPATVARRTARARVGAAPRLKNLLGGERRGPEPGFEGDPRSDTAAAAAHMVGVLWVTQSQGATVKELRAAIGITRERLEAAYEYLTKRNPVLGLAVQRHGDELRLVSDGGVAASVERHLNAPRAVSLSGAAQQVLAIIAYRQPVSQAGIESVRGTSSDRALGTRLQRTAPAALALSAPCSSAD